MGLALNRRGLGGRRTVPAVPFSAGRAALRLVRSVLRDEVWWLGVEALSPYGCSNSSATQSLPPTSTTATPTRV